MLQTTCKPKGSVAPTFPALYVSKENGYIILACRLIGKDLYGTVLTTGGSYKPGHYSEDWMASCFEPYFGSVTLTQD